MAAVLPTPVPTPPPPSGPYVVIAEALGEQFTATGPMTGEVPVTGPGLSPSTVDLRRLEPNAPDTTSHPDHSIWYVQEVGTAGSSVSRWCGGTASGSDLSPTIEFRDSHRGRHDGPEDIDDVMTQQADPSAPAAVS
jgi:hypothetical protein